MLPRDKELLLSTRAREAITATNTDLCNELAMYRSVMVPSENKPRTNITRIERVPMGNQNLNLNASAGVKSVGRGGERMILTSLDSIPGEMTLDEIL